MRSRRQCPVRCRCPNRWKARHRSVLRRMASRHRALPYRRRDAVPNPRLVRRRRQRPRRHSPRLEDPRQKGSHRRRHKRPGAESRLKTLEAFAECGLWREPEPAAVCASDRSSFRRPTGQRLCRHRVSPFVDAHLRGSIGPCGRSDCPTSARPPICPHQARPRGSATPQLAPTKRPARALGIQQTHPDVHETTGEHCAANSSVVVRISKDVVTARIEGLFEHGVSHLQIASVFTVIRIAGHRCCITRDIVGAGRSVSPDPCSCCAGRQPCLRRRHRLRTHEFGPDGVRKV